MRTLPIPRRLGALTLAIVSIWVVATSAAAGDEAACSEKPLVVKVHASWCASCKVLAATWSRVETELGERATIVVFDVSDRVAYEQSRAEAQRLGIDEFFQEFRKQTGTVAVLDCETREPVVVLKGERDYAKYVEAVDKAGHSS